MGYCTEDQIRQDRSCSNLPKDIILNAIDEASALIDNKLRARYTVPFSVAPRGIDNLCKDLTVCNLLNSFKSIEALNARDALDVIAFRCERAMELLNEYRDGRMTLDVPTTFDATKEADDSNTNDVLFYAGRSDIVRG